MSFIFLLYSCNYYEDEQIEEGNKIVERIETYKLNKGYLPATLEEVDKKSDSEGTFYYERSDSVNYVLWFGTSLGEGMYYYSDTKTWDYRLRGMGEKR